MAKCQFCSQEQKEWDGKHVGHVSGVVCENGDGQNHVHVHGDFNNRVVVEDIIKATSEAAGIKSNQVSDKMTSIKEIIFHNRQRIGDMLMFTCGVRDFAKAYPHIKVNVISTCGHIWDNNPYIDRSIQPYYKNGITLEKCTAQDFLDGNTNVLKIGPSKGTNQSNRIDWHFANAFRLSIEDNLGIHIPQGESRPDIYLTEDEYNAPRITDKPYWIIITGGEKGWGCKMYPTTRWQEVVDQNPDILFYQLGALGDNHVKLRGSNVVDYIGKTESRETGIRDLFKLFLNAEGSIGLVSFHMHLSGALKKPCVVVAGAREPVSFTRYAGHQYIATDGTLPCAVTACWHCDLKACTNQVTVSGEVMPRCVDMIKSTDVTSYLRRYYDGGRLSYTKPSDKPKLDLVKTPRLVASVNPSVNINTYGMTFGGGSLTEKDWEFISKVIDEHKVKSVLEFGAGLSTLLLNDTVKSVTTYETNQRWIDKINKIKPCNIKLWDGKSWNSFDYLIDEKFDMAFVDGPAGDIGREQSTKIASDKAKIVIVHDAGREWARKYQEKYLQGGFDGPIKGGNRCHCWIRKETQATIIPITPRTKQVDKQFIKFVSTAKGWGGCARSITTIMELLLKAGHSVEFIPFRNAVGSSEFNQWIKTHPNLKVTTKYSTISEHCDVLFMYADDYIWEFNKPEIAEVFSSINADNRIMVLNYRRGSVGQAEWTKGWDKYMFLNSTQEKELLELIPSANTKVLPPCTDLSKFLAMKPDFTKNIRIVRHSSQGDTKYSPEFNYEMDRILYTHNDLTISLMPAPSFVQKNSRIICHPRNKPPIPEFLAQGNLFWYSLPQGYSDMGPRVILEAMAVGLPILADNWGGAVDRVTPECGWLCNTKDEHSAILKNLTLSQLEKMGNASKERAYTFSQDAWIHEITG